VLVVIGVGIEVGVAVWVAVCAQAFGAKHSHAAIRHKAIRSFANKICDSFFGLDAVLGDASLLKERGPMNLCPVSSCGSRRCRNHY
jgi:hypothetical protein